MNPADNTEEMGAAREPCPWRILEDAGGAFAMGAVGGSFFHAYKGYKSSPPGLRAVSMIKAVKFRAPLLGGSFAIWGTFYSGFDCSLMGIRGEDDMWNSIAAGFLTGGTLAIRQGPRQAFGAAAFGGIILGVIEGIQLVLSNAMASAAAPQAPRIEEAPPVPTLN